MGSPWKTKNHAVHSSGWWCLEGTSCKLQPGLLGLLSLSETGCLTRSFTLPFRPVSISSHQTSPTNSPFQMFCCSASIFVACGQNGLLVPSLTFSPLDDVHVYPPLYRPFFSNCWDLTNSSVREKGFILAYSLGRERLSWQGVRSHCHGSQEAESWQEAGWSYKTWKLVPCPQWPISSSMAPHQQVTKGFNTQTYRGHF